MRAEPTSGPGVDIGARLIVVGGAQRVDARSRPPWDIHDRGLVLECDTKTGEWTNVVDLAGPATPASPSAPFGLRFGSASIDGALLYTCTQIEVLVYDIATWKLVESISHPWLNAAHCVRPRASGTVLVVSTGIDAVLELSRSGELVSCWGVSGDPWASRSSTVDYRTVPTTKPHRSHPNSVFEIGDDIWVTRFEERDAVCVTRPGRFFLGGEGPHDGIPCDRRVFFTAVDGQIRVIDQTTGRLDEIIDLSNLYQGPLSVGWCRGLAVFDNGARVIVGFSRLRDTRLRANTRWVAHRLRLHPHAALRSTRIACFNLSTREIEWEVDLEPMNMAMIYSVHLHYDARSY